MDRSRLLTRIYGLCDPATGEVRYVGKTTSSLRARLSRHLRETTRTNTRNGRWLASLQRRDAVPLIIELEVVYGEGWAERERSWIAFYRSTVDLLNHSDGGDGTPGVAATPQARMAVSRANRIRCWSETVAA
jgi:hypothetical protein